MGFRLQGQEDFARRSILWIDGEIARLKGVTNTFPKP